MLATRKVEIFSAGCKVCDESVNLVRRLACSSCEIIVHDMQARDGAERAARLGVCSLPALAIDGHLAAWCAGPGFNEANLKSAGIGRPLSAAS